MQSVLSRIWTRIAVFISYGDNDYTTGTSVNGPVYRTLHSYNLIWAVCHLFPRQRWWTHTYSVSGNHWPEEPRDLRKTTSAPKFRPAFGATSKTRIFYKYVAFKHSFSFYTISSRRQHTPSSLTQQTSNSNNMDGPRRHSKYTLTMRHFQFQRKRLFPTIKRKTF